MDIDDNYFNTALKKCLSMDNVKNAEFFIETTEKEEISFENCEITEYRTIIQSGLSIRTYNNNGSFGFSYTNLIDKKSINECIRYCINLMKSCSPDPFFKKLPLGTKSIIENDFRSNQNSIEKKTNISNLVGDFLNFNHNYNINLQVKLEKYKKDIRVLNTNGLDIKKTKERSSILTKIRVKNSDLNKVGYGASSQFSRKINEETLEQVLNDSFKLAIQKSNIQKLCPQRLPVILNPRGVICFILNPIAQSVNADTYYNQRCFLHNQIGKKISTELVEIEDNPHLVDGINSSLYDDEGAKCQKTRIIEKGIFTGGLLHNNYTANRYNASNTGNGYRDTYNVRPQIRISNLVMKSGKSTIDSLVSSITKGVLLNYTPDMPNLVNGKFIGQAIDCFLIEDGEIKSILYPIRFRTNILDLYKEIEQISKEKETIGEYSAPMVKVHSMEFV